MRKKPLIIVGVILAGGAAAGVVAYQRGLLDRWLSPADFADRHSLDDVEEYASDFVVEDEFDDEDLDADELEDDDLDADELEDDELEDEGESTAARHAIPQDDEK